VLLASCAWAVTAASAAAPKDFLNCMMSDNQDCLTIVSSSCLRGIER
jgi:hypothetical protein